MTAARSYGGKPCAVQIASRGSIGCGGVLADLAGRMGMDLKAQLAEFGLVEVCRLPSPARRAREPAFVQFATARSAAAAVEASQAGLLTLLGEPLEAVLAGHSFPSAELASQQSQLKDLQLDKSSASKALPAPPRLQTPSPMTPTRRAPDVERSGASGGSHARSLPALPPYHQRDHQEQQSSNLISKVDLEEDTDESAAPSEGMGGEDPFGSSGEESATARPKAAARNPPEGKPPAPPADFRKEVAPPPPDPRLERPDGQNRSRPNRSPSSKRERSASVESASVERSRRRSLSPVTPADRPPCLDAAGGPAIGTRCVGVVISMGDRYGFIRGEEAYLDFGKDVFLDLSENVGAAGLKRGTMVQFTYRELPGKGPQAYATAPYRLKGTEIGRQMEQRRLEAFIKSHLSAPMDWEVEDKLRKTPERLQAEIMNRFGQKWRRGTVREMVERVVQEDEMVNKKCKEDSTKRRRSSSQESAHRRQDQQRTNSRSLSIPRRGSGVGNRRSLSIPRPFKGANNRRGERGPSVARREVHREPSATRRELGRRRSRSRGAGRSSVSVERRSSVSVERSSSVSVERRSSVSCSVSLDRRSSVSVERNDVGGGARSAPLWQRATPEAAEQLRSPFTQQGPSQRSRTRSPENDFAGEPSAAQTASSSSSQWPATMRFPAPPGSPPKPMPEASKATSNVQQTMERHDRDRASMEELLKVNLSPHLDEEEIDDRPISPIEPPVVKPITTVGATDTEEEEEESNGEPTPTSPAADAPAEKHGVLLEVRGLESVTTMSNSSTDGMLAELLNPILEMLPDYKKGQGPPVVRTWVGQEKEIGLELQNAKLCSSAVRVLDGMDLFSQSISVRVLDSSSTAPARKIDKAQKTTVPACKRGSVAPSGKPSKRARGSG